MKSDCQVSSTPYQSEWMINRLKKKCTVFFCCPSGPRGPDPCHGVIRSDDAIDPNRINLQSSTLCRGICAGRLQDWTKHFWFVMISCVRSTVVYSAPHSEAPQNKNKNEKQSDASVDAGFSGRFPLIMRAYTLYTNPPLSLWFDLSLHQSLIQPSLMTRLSLVRFLRV